MFRTAGAVGGGKGGTFFSMEQKKPRDTVFLEAAPELKCKVHFGNIVLEYCLLE